ncbi:hypothetical protein A4H97_03385 [Niastella yeongjuensis]|uniref:Lipoprotein n=1 Tax=Niastella yeongjuensis TaxID=354355 RepID=A0A1V9EXP2_9BACT|nr:hypothetical protein [Niastella yeongjuensis]OQP50881.1 hypothetical protein A4H97_03385 [Niastella yeongjuensis]SEN13333.1 hypothetical protein SAMN05660816_00263 [Niastella yeongjuensis]
MTNKLISAILLIVLAFSCNTKPNITDNYSLKDTILEKHFKAIESSDDFDSTDLNYKVLKAYVNNDTLFFKNLESDIVDNERYNKQWQSMDSCIHQSKIQSMDVDEAYRFIYSAAFCPYKINVTVSKKADSSNLHFILYQYKWDTADCNIISEYDKKLTTKNWEDITESLSTSDFWGLKKDNGVHGVDGSSLTVTGYKNRDSVYNRPAKFHYVYRWSQNVLRDPFHLILKLSGNQKGCLWVK